MSNSNNLSIRRPLTAAITAALAIFTVDASAVDNVKTRQPIEHNIYWRALSTATSRDTVTYSADGRIRLATMRLYQDVAPILPLPQQLSASPTGSSGAGSLANIFRGRGDSRLASLANSRAGRARVGRRVAVDRILGIESRARSSRDVASLISRSARNRGVVAQKRNPIISDPRIRGSRVGQLAASGSYWIPARIDLDTMLSKIDSDLIAAVDVVKGPYAVDYGPGTSFLSFDLKPSPRSVEGPQAGGSTSLEYQTNGEQWYGRQSVNYADQDWGMRIGYGHRTGSDYRSGGGVDIPSSYKSRDFDVAFGFDPTSTQSFEFMYLHQDQTDIELPGQAFDLDVLATRAVELKWSKEDASWADRVDIETWYNQSQLKGNSQSPAKRATFPFLDLIRYVGTTDVESLSTGAKIAATWNIDMDRFLRSGIDIRVVRQELDELSSGRFGFNIFTNANSPIPRSAAVNPGLFIEFTDTSHEDLTLTAGARTDVITTEVLADASSLTDLSTGALPLSLADILGTGDFDQSFGVWSAFASAEYALSDAWTVSAAAGHGQRPPSLTELYAAESFMFLIQSGLNTITGDPRLNPEKHTQIDLGTSFVGDRFRASVNGYHAWIHDRITFEGLSIRRGPPFNQIEQTNLKYVNTDRATVYGLEADAEFDLFDGLSVFGTLSYVRGTDHTRNGSFATFQAVSPTMPSVRVDGRQRGDFIQAGNLPDEEPLPGIPPLESRLGIRADGTFGEMIWNIELAARVVDNQTRVASLLNESQTLSFTVLDLRGYLRVTDQISIFAGVENLADKDYREHFDFRSLTENSVRQPGINAYFGTEVVY